MSTPPSSPAPSTPTPISPSPVGPPGHFALLSPELGDIAISPNLTFSWQSSDHATEYRLRGVNPIVSRSVSSTSLTTSELQPGAYFWHVEAVNSAGRTNSTPDNSWFAVPLPLGGEPRAIAMSGARAWVSNATGAGSIDHYDLEFGGTYGSIAVHGKPAKIAISPDGWTGAVATDSGIVLFNASTLTTRILHPGCSYTQSFTDLAFTPNSRSLIVPGVGPSCVGTGVFVIDLATAASSFYGDGGTRSYWTVAVSADGKTAYVGVAALGEKPRAFDLQSHTFSPISGIEGTTNLVLTPDGKHLIASNTNGTIALMLLNLADGSVKPIANASTDATIQGLAVTSDSARLVAITAFHAFVIDLSTGTLIRESLEGGRQVTMCATDLACVTSAQDNTIEFVPTGPG